MARAKFQCLKFLDKENNKLFDQKNVRYSILKIVHTKVSFKLFSVMKDISQLCKKFSLDNKELVDNQGKELITIKRLCLHQWI